MDTLQHQLALLFECDDGDTMHESALKNALAQRIHYLIHHNISLLYGLLYQIDVNENKLKALLTANAGTDAGKIIAAAIIERQKEKIISRQRYQRNQEDISDEEEW